MRSEPAASCPECLDGTHFGTELRTMISVTIQDLKQTLAEIIGRIEHGESIVITRHGRPVARLVPHADPNVHTGADFGSREPLEPLGDRATGGKYLEILRDDRRGGER